MNKGIMLAFLVAASGFAQGTTWNGLKFGSSLADVKASLSPQGLTLQRSDAGWQVKPRWNLKLPGMKIPFHFSPYLLFSDTNKLEQIELLLGTEQHKSEGVDAIPLTSVAAESIHQQLVGKYGKPISQSGVCERVSLHDLVGGSGKAECETVWKVVGQTVTLKWVYFKHSLGVGELVFFIRYLPSQSGGL
jgi:hypothetical protein